MPFGWSAADHRELEVFLGFVEIVDVGLDPQQRGEVVVETVAGRLVLRVSDLMFRH